MKEHFLYERVSRYFSHDLTAYASSRQNQSQLNLLPFLNSLFPVIVILSLLFQVLLTLKFPYILNRQIKIIAVVLFLGIVLNAWDCGTFTNAIDRLGCKMIWLTAFMTAVLFSQVWYNRQKRE